MAVIAHVILPGVTPEQFDAVRDAAGYLHEAPAGGFIHCTWWDGNDCHNVDAWESEEAFAAFGENVLGPAIAQQGVAVDMKVDFFPAHEVYAPKAVTLTS